MFPRAHARLQEKGSPWTKPTAGQLDPPSAAPAGGHAWASSFRSISDEFYVVSKEIGSLEVVFPSNGPKVKSGCWEVEL